MYRMEYSIFGFKFNVLNALIFLVVGFLVATLTVCSCSRVKSVGDAINMVKGKKTDKKDGDKH